MLPKPLVAQEPGHENQRGLHYLAPPVGVLLLATSPRRRRKVRLAPWINSSMLRALLT
jgi:hypothetical protein